jgi:hypothetical protein
MIGYGGDDSNDEEALEDVAVWREVHSTLLLAVRKAQDAIAIQKAQRRYWMEEIAWNLGEDGSLTPFSSWNRPVSVSNSSLSVSVQRGVPVVGTGSSRKKREAALSDSRDNAKPAKKPRTKKAEQNLELVAKKPRKGKVEPSAWTEDETARTSPDVSDTLERFSQSNSPAESTTRPTYDEWEGPSQNTANDVAHNESVSPLSRAGDAFANSSDLSCCPCSNRPTFSTSQSLVTVMQMMQSHLKILAIRPQMHHHTIRTNVPTLRCSNRMRRPWATDMRKR